MSLRWRAFGWHLAASFLVLSGIIAALYVGWYRWPGWYLTGAETIVAMLVLVDVGIGPLATLIVTTPHKPRAVWRRDIAVILLVQLAALGYGSHSLWNGRPLVVAYSENQIAYLQALDFKDAAIGDARSSGATVIPEWYWTLRWVWAPLPASLEERRRFIELFFTTGEDVTLFPKYYRPWSEGTEALKMALFPVERLATIKADDWGEQEYQTRLAQLQRPTEEIGVLPAGGALRSGTWIFDRRTGEPLAFWPVASWELRARK